MKLLKQTDKQLHAVGSYVLTIFFYLFLQDINESMVVAFTIGIAKEIYDIRYPKKHTADVMDIVANVIGIALAVLSLNIWEVI